MRFPRLLLLSAALCFAGCGAVVPCGNNSRLADVCVQCGPAGGCAKTESRCAQTCTSSADCTGGGGTGCFNGVCQLIGCI